MFFENFDFLSPKITLFYKYKQRHSSPIGGILTTLMILICILFVLRFLINLLFHSTPSVIFFKKYEKNIKKYPLDSSSIPHLIWISNNNNKIINSKTIRVILLAEDNNYAANTSNLKNYEHWVYDSCTESDFNNYEYYQNLIYDDDYINNNNNKKDLSNAICIRYYYNKIEQIYYSSNNSNFKYPYLENGKSNRNNTILSTFIEKCSNDSITNSILDECETEENIQNYLKEKNLAYMQILDHQVDLTNLKTPIKSYFMGISSFLLHNNGYEVNTINFSPLLIRSNQNYINNDYIEKNTIIIDNTQSTIIGGKDKILLKYLFCIQNYKQIYERKYIDLFDTFSSIGGIVQFFYYVFYVINYFYNDYILILNTQNLFLNDPKNRKISKLIPFNRQSNSLTPKNLNKNNILFRNYESGNILQELRCYKLVTKVNNINDGDLSSIQLSESNNDNDSYFFFNRKKDKDISEIEDKKLRKSLQLNSKIIQSMKLKEDINKKNIRYSMFNPKNTVIISPNNHDFTSKNFNNLMILSSNGDLNNYKEHLEIENSLKKKNKNDTYSKKITLIDNRDRNYNLKKNHSFAENVKMLNFLKNNKDKALKQELPQKYKKRHRKTIIDYAREKYYSQRLTFKDYIRFMCSIKNKRRDILIIQQFRKKLLSEEHFFKSHLFICLIIQKIKIDKDDKSDIKELYSEL
jgi:hypothetical protein